MSLFLRIVLIVASITNLAFVLVRIRRSKIHIADSVFWIMLSALFILFAADPELAVFFAKVIGIQTAANFIFLLIIFLLFIKTFLLSMKLSSAEIKIKKLSQKIALDEYKLAEEEEEKKQFVKPNKKYLSINK